MAQFKEFRRGYQPWEHGKGGGGGGGDMRSSALDHDFVSTVGGGIGGGGDPWEKIAPWIAQTGFGAEAPERAADATAAWLKAAGAKSVLEVGCGVGRGTKRLAAGGFALRAVEESGALIAAARDVAPGASIEEASLTDAPPGPYDAVVSVYPAFSRLTLAGQAEAFLESARAQLGKGGHLSFVFYNLDGVDEGELCKVFLRGPYRVGGEQLVIYDQWQHHPDGGDRFVWVPLFAPGDYSIHWARRSVPYRFWRANEVRQAVEDAGFQGVELLDADDPASREVARAKRVMVRARAR
jgi:SAM-dependent methyltransferase